MKRHFLTAKQNALLSFIECCNETPSFEEMRIAVGLKSKSGVARLIDALEERGFIRRMRNRARAIEVVPREFVPSVIVPQSKTLRDVSTDDLLVEVRSRGFLVSIPLRAA